MLTDSHGGASSDTTRGETWCRHSADHEQNGTLQSCVFHSLQVCWSALLINIHRCVCSRMHTLSILSCRSSYPVNHRCDQQDCARPNLRSVSKIIGYIPSLLLCGFSCRATVGWFSCAINHCLHQNNSFLNYRCHLIINDQTLLPNECRICLPFPYNTVTSAVTCLPNRNPWLYGFDFYAALLLHHWASANIRWTGLKINVPSTVWLIHSLSGVITVPSATMSQVRWGEVVLDHAKKMNEEFLQMGEIW